MTTGGYGFALRLRVKPRNSRRAAALRAVAVRLIEGLCLGLLCASLAAPNAMATDGTERPSILNQLSHVNEGAAAVATSKMSPLAAYRPEQADFKQRHASRDARQVADWVVESGDNRGLPFVIVDKTDARVFVFDAGGRLRGAAPALVGLARGDDSVPGIGEREMSDIRPDERTTPAGRFVASLGYDFSGQDVLWVDYDDAIALHRVVTSNPAERRLQRLATATPADNRISYGCINVPKEFYENIVSPAFTGTDGIVYVLPETRPLGQVFATYDADARARGAGARMPAQLAGRHSSRESSRP